MVALATALAFVSCSNGDDDGGSSTVATYTGKNAPYTLTFFGDGNGSGTWTITDATNKNKNFMEGTYRGLPDKNGNIYMIVTKRTDEFGNYIDISQQTEEVGFEVDDGEFELDFEFKESDNLVFTRQ